jgi:hypothetical protein
MAEEVSQRIATLEAKIKVLKETAKAHAVFDKDHLETQFDNTSRLIWWISQRQDYTTLFNKLDLQRKKTRCAVVRQWATDSSLKLSKAEIENFADTDSQFVEDDAVCKLVESILKFIEGTIKILGDKKWEMKGYQHYLDWKEGK